MAANASVPGKDGAQEVLRVPVEELGEHLDTLEAELSGGRAIELVRGGKVIAEIRSKPGAEVAVGRAEAEVPPLPDFMGRMREIWGDKVFPEGTGVKMLREDRDARG